MISRSVRATGVFVHQNAKYGCDPSRLGAREPLPVPETSRADHRAIQCCTKLRRVLSGAASPPIDFGDSRGAAQSQSRRIAALLGECQRPNAANQNWDVRSTRASPNAWARAFLPK